MLRSTGSMAHGERPLKIVHVVAVGGHGGPVQSLLTLLPHLSSFHRVLAGPLSETNLRRVSDGRLVEEVIGLPRARGLAQLSFAMRLAARLFRHPPDVIHANGLTELALVLPAMLVTRARLIVWVHNYEQPRSAQWIRRLAVRLHGRTQWFAVSNLAAQVAADAGLVEFDDVAILPNPISEEVVVGTTSRSTNHCTVGYFGTSRHYKGFDLLPDVIESIGPSVKWKIFATDHGGPTMSRLADFGAKWVELVGRMEPVGPGYAMCDLVFIPSRQESFCRVAAEAMLNGLPVVATDLPPLRDLVGDRKAGLLFPVDDVPGAVGCLKSLVDDPELRATLGQEGRARAAAYSPPFIAERLRVALLGPISKCAGTCAEPT